MYIPAHFNESRPEQLHALIAQHPLGILVANGKSGLSANHLPFMLHPQEGPQGVLHCHVARNNPVWQDLTDGDEVMVIFRAGDAYISPQWFPSKHETHKQVPSWNYIVAHAYGRVKIRDEERYVRGAVARLTRIHEASQAVPWKMTDGPKDYIDAMLKAIVGIEVEITRLIGKTKLSQNKDARDVEAAAEGLASQGKHFIGSAMQTVAADKRRQESKE